MHPGSAKGSILQKIKFKGLKKNNGVFVDLSRTAKDEDLRKDPIHLNDAGYREAAIKIGKTLGFDDRWIGNPHVEKLRSQILKKNVWWFHRSRPANMAYVFGFRKREQGQNAVEIPQYDPLIAEEEQYQRLHLFVDRHTYL